MAWNIAVSRVESLCCSPWLSSRRSLFVLNFGRNNNQQSNRRMWPGVLFAFYWRWRCAAQRLSALQQSGEEWRSWYLGTGTFPYACRTVLSCTDQHWHHNYHSQDVMTSRWRWINTNQRLLFYHVSSVRFPSIAALQMQNGRSADLSAMEGSQITAKILSSGK